MRAIVRLAIQPFSCRHADAASHETSPGHGPPWFTPTLAPLEDMDLVAAQAQGNGRKQYRISEQGDVPAGTAGIAASPAGTAGPHPAAPGGTRAAEIARAFENLKTAMRIRFADGAPSEDMIQRIAQIIDQAAFSVGRIQ